MTRPPNILMITTDEERFRIPSPQGYTLPARERLAAARCHLRQLLRRFDHVQLVAVGDVHRTAPPDHRDLRQRQHAVCPPAGSQPRHARHDAASRGILLHLPGQVAPVERLRRSGASGSDDERPGTVRVLRVERLGRHRRWRLGRAQGRSRRRRPGGEVVARPCAGGVGRPAVVHVGQLRQPARHHELRLRRQVHRAAPPVLATRSCTKPPADIPVYRAAMGLRPRRRTCTTTSPARLRRCASTHRCSTPCSASSTKTHTGTTG